MWTGTITLRNDARSLPDGLQTANLDIDGCNHFTALPENLRARRAIIRNCRAFEWLPSSAWFEELVLDGCPWLATLPEAWSLASLTIRDCPRLTTLPAGLSVSVLHAQRSPLRTLPDDLRVARELDLSGSLIGALPSGFRCQRVVLRQCRELRELPENLDVDELDLSG